MGEVQWIKLYIDMFDRRKINKIRRLPDGDKILLFWVMLLATAGKCNAGGMIYITERVAFTKEDLADEFDFEISTIELALKAFEELDMIDIYDGGFISVRNWEKYQSTDKLAEIREQTRKRVAKCRENKRLAECNVTSNVTSNGCNDIEEEGEEELDLEKESHSFIPRVREDESEEERYYRERLELKTRKGSLCEGLVLSDEQFDDLCERLSYDEINKYMAIVRDCEKNGQHFKKKTHYQAILDMVNKDRRVKKG